MLPCIVYEPSEPIRIYITDCLKRFSERAGVRMRLLVQTDSIKTAASFIKSERGPVLLFSSVDQSKSSGIKLGDLAMRQNRDNYVVYCLCDINILNEVSLRVNRPAGFLILPPDSTRLMGILKRVYDDYIAMYAGESASDVLTIHKGSEIFRMPLGYIRYIEAAEKKVMFYTKEQCIGVYDNLSRISEILGDRFIQCHRSYIINPDHVENIDFTKMFITMTGGGAVPLSRSFRGIVRERFSITDAVSVQYASS